MAAVGDQVEYVPGPWHAKDRMADGTYAYAFAWKDDKSGKIGDKMPNDQIKIKLATIHRLGKLSPPIKKHDHLIYLGPQVTFPATVSTVNTDGSCDLEIKSPLGGVMLQYPAVPTDPTGKTPHTWHAKGA